MRVLLVDNHDSYTYNLYHLLARVLGKQPTVVTNDAPDFDRLDLDRLDAAVISPGPGRPQHPRDLGRVPQLLAATHLPILGVCLGHQAIAHHAQAPVGPAPTPLHGHLSRIHHHESGLFAQLPQNFTAVRYHSLAAAHPLPAPLSATAWAEDDVVMALEHATLPRWGVQFHPESIATEHGETLIANFARLAHMWRPHPPRPPHTQPRPPFLTETPNHTRTGEHTPSHLDKHTRTPTETRATPAGPQSGEAPRVRVLNHAADTEHAFTHLYGDAAHAFWLDSSRRGSTGRFSFLGAATGEVLTYRVGEGTVNVTESGTTRHEAGTIFDALRRRVARHPHSGDPRLPFDFTGGYVGYFGYELKADCGATATHRASTPDAVWLRCDRVVAVDHDEQRTYLVTSAEDPDAEHWLDTTEHALIRLRGPAAPPTTFVPTGTDLEILLERPREQYLTDIKQCLNLLAAGESYEVCLTNRLRLPVPHDELAYYRWLRSTRPAPYAALLRLGELSVLSTSPERFLRVDAHGTVDSRPIKGTAPRHHDPTTDQQLARQLRSDAKTRAENLMIVDLQRNDLGRVCQVGSVAVPAFIYTESYATVHQLVSTVQGRLEPDVTAVDAVRACFPGGSMTGAPKRRTMEIIDELETSARGIYSGALGYLSHSGTADLSIVIRTAIRHGGELTIGAGGAIVLDSDPAEEYAEMLLKAAVPAGVR